MSKDLRLIAEILERNCGNVCSDPSPLKRAADGIRTQHIGNATTWEYNLDGLHFRVDKPKGTLPSWIGKHLSVELDVGAKCNCNPDAWDPFEHLEVNIQVFAGDRASSDASISSWHLDRHIGEDDPQEMHPLYHFQHGGKQMTDIGDSIGRVLLLKPRDCRIRQWKRYCQ